jgi:rhodanese-related sulfurtransferase
MSIQTTTKQLANLVPLTEVDQEMRSAMRGHSEVLKLIAGQVLVCNPREEQLYLLGGSVVPTESDGKPGAPVVTQEWQAFEPNHSITPCRKLTAGPQGAQLARLDRGRVGTLLGWSELSQRGAKAALPNAWLPSILRSELLARLPGENLQAALSRAKALNVNAGETLVTQGEPGEHYFLILDGEFAVMRTSDSGLSLLIAQLIAGDSFGEEALLSDAVRNATVEVERAGLVLRLAKSDFMELIGSALVHSISPQAALDALHDGEATFMDVRTAEEFAHDGMEGAINIPLATLRDSRESLWMERHYVVVCDSGRRSAAAAFLMCEWGINADSVSGGLLALGAKRSETSKDEPSLAGLQDVLETVDEALEIALHERASIAPLDMLPEDEDRTDPSLRARIDETRDHIGNAQQAKVALEKRIRDLRATKERDFATLEALRNRLREEANELLANERERLREEYKRATQVISELRTRKADIISDAQHNHRTIDENLNESHRELDREAAQVHQALLKTRDQALERERQIRTEQTEQESEAVRTTQSRLRVERERLEGQVAQSLASIQDAERKLDSLESQRTQGKRRSAERAQARQKQREEWRQSVHEEIAAASADGGVEGGEEAIRLAQTAASQESLRLELHNEVEALLADEQEVASERAQEAQRKLDFIARRDKAAREKLVSDTQSEQNLLADLQAQLGESEHATGNHVYEKQRARLAGEATDTSAIERKAAENALKRARAHIAKLKSQMDKS